MKILVPYWLKNTVLWSFGVFVICNGLLNLVFGNDPGLGVTFMVLSFLYFPPIVIHMRRRYGIRISVWARLLTALFILWVTGAVGALAEGYVF